MYFVELILIPESVMTLHLHQSTHLPSVDVQCVSLLLIIVLNRAGAHSWLNFCM